MLDPVSSQLTRCTGDREQLYIFYYPMGTVFALTRSYFRIKSNRIILPLIFFFLLPSLAIYSPQPLYGLFKFIIYLAVFKGVAANSRYLTFSLWSCYSVARRNIRRYSRGLHYRRWTHTGYITIKRRQRSNGTH